MGRPRKSNEELAASGSVNLSRRRAAAGREAEARAVAAIVAAARVVERPPMPKSVAEWHAILRLLPGFDPFLLAPPCPSEGWQGARFDERAASKPIDWIETNVRHTKGPKAGELLILEPWQRSFVANLFGWIRLGDGRRRFREFLLYLPKKSGKTEICAAIALYMLLEDGEGGPEVYCAAASQKQAGKLFAQCKKTMSRLDPAESRATRYQHAITVPDGGFLQAISSEAKTEDGMNPSCALLDELWNQPDSELFDVLRLSGRSRSQPIFGSLTTADFDRPSVCNTTLARAKKVRGNPGDPLREGFDPKFLPAIWEADPKEDPYSPATWAKCNPNLGVTVSLEDFASEARDAKENPPLRPNFFRLCLNLRTTAVMGGYYKPEDWDACAGLVDYRVLRERLKGKRCFGGLDMATVTDLTSLALWFPDEKAALWWTWCPRNTAAEKSRVDRVPYLQWADEGALILTGEGATDRTVSYAKVTADILAARSTYKIQEIGFDPNGANATVTALRDEHGLKLLDYNQSFKRMTNPSKELARMMGAREFVHGGDPCARWAVLNIVMREGDVGSYIQPHKGKSLGRIDPGVALIMAIGVATELQFVQPAPQPRLTL